MNAPILEIVDEGYLVASLIKSFIFAHKNNLVSKFNFFIRQVNLQFQMGLVFLKIFKWDHIFGYNNTFMKYYQVAFYEKMFNWKFPRLKPDTDYMARIAIYKEYSTRTLGKSTAVIEFKTSSKFTTYFTKCKT